VNTERTRLELDTMNILRGTQDLRDRIELALSTGTPSISDLAYATKLRVKEDHSVVSKVLKKRQDKPEYGVDALRDVVGLRIVTLYRLDALQIIPLVIEMIDGSGETGPFVRESLEEVRIYVTNPAGDAQGLTEKLARTFANSGYRPQPTIENNPNNYTSIHMVAWGLGKYQDDYRRIPVEIQIRTAFEDVWGEIEHKLKYKRKSVNLRDGSEEAVRLDQSLAHLNVLKAMVDGIAQYADQIKIQLEAGDATLVKTSFARSAEEPMIRLKGLKDLPESLRTDIQKAAALAKPALESGPTASTVEKVKQLKAALAEFRAVRTKADDLDLSARTRRETTYVVDMQIALILSEIGNASSDGRAYLEEAAHLYAALEHVMPNRLVILYRNAKVLDALGLADQAVEKLRTVVERLANPKEVTPKHHWIRSAAPRVLGVILWEEAMRVGQLGGPGDSKAAERKVELLGEAYAITKTAYGRRVSEDPFETPGQPTEQAKAANNLLYYALELADAQEMTGKARTALAEEVAQYLSDMRGTDPDKIDDPRFLNTVTRAYLFLNDLPKAKASARRFIAIVEPLTGAQWARTPLNEIMENLARTVLATPDE